MTHQTGDYARQVRAILSSRQLFRGIVALLILQAGWIALSSRYPMAFDEDFHLGIIRLYAHHLSPFWSQQPAQANVFGALSHDPSYLYHYLMSFPYRFVSLFTSNQVAMVISLRAIDIAFMAAGLVVWRKVLLASGASVAISQVCLLAFVLIPAVPLLSAQINYDDLVIPLTGLVLLLTIRWSRALKKRQPNLKLLTLVLVLSLLTSLVKYAFLPILLAVVIYIIFQLQTNFKAWPKLVTAYGSELTRLKRFTKVSLSLVLIVAIGLFVQCYGTNLVRYHTLVPDCSQVLNVHDCRAYGPWQRNYDLHNEDLSKSRNVVLFTAQWLYGMWFREYFAVSGPLTDNKTSGPLLLPGAISILAILGGSVVVWRYGKRIWLHYNHEALSLFGIASLCYVIALWFDDLKNYLYSGQVVAVNGRYLFPILLLIMVVVALGFNEAFQGQIKQKAILVTVAIVCLAWGGGGLTYVLRASSDWYWNSREIRQVNKSIQHIIGPIVPGYYFPTEFMWWN